MPKEQLQTLHNQRLKNHLGISVQSPYLTKFKDLERHLQFPLDHLKMLPSLTKRREKLKSRTSQPVLGLLMLLIQLHLSKKVRL